MSRTKGTYTLTSNIEPKVGAPLDARTIVKLLADLTANNTFEYPYKGMKVFVEENNKSYTLVGSDPTISSNWTEDGSGGGHTIKNPSGTAMTQRSNLQFVDLTVSDDSTNDATKVENIHVIQSESELTNLPDGLYMLDDDEGTVIDSNLVGYDNTDSELNAENVQDAIDEIIGSLGTAATKDIPATGNAGLTEVVMGNDTRLSDARTPVSHTHTTSDISDFPTMSDYIQKSDTTGFVKNDGSIDTNTYLNSTLKGTANGVAELDENGKVPSAQLPSYVDDVLEYASVSAFPATGESGKIYIALDTNKTYRWGGSEYVEISESLALGETSSTAYRGDRGKTAYDHSQLISGNPHKVSKSDVGLGNVDNTSDSTKKTNFTGSIASGNTGFTTGGDVYTALQGKVNTETGKGLSTNDYTTAEKNKLSGISTGANKTEASTTNGNIKIDNVETPVYRNYANNTVLTTDKSPYLNRPCLTPTGFSSYVREKLIGCSVAWNQLVQNGDFSDSSTKWSGNGGTLTVNSGIGSFIATQSPAYCTNNYNNLISGHKYLASLKVKLTTYSADIRFRFYRAGNGETYVDLANTTSWQRVFVIVSQTVNATDANIGIKDARSSGWDAIQIDEAQIIDLTLAFGSTIADYLYGLSNNGGITKLRDMGCPIDKYTAYGNYLVSSQTSGKKIVGFNTCDEIWESGTIDNNTGQDSIDANNIRTKNYIPCLPNTQYYVRTSSRKYNWIHFYDAGKNWISGTDMPQGGGAITSPSNAHYYRTRTTGNYGSVYQNDICINLYDSSKNGQYEPYSCTTYSLGSTELRGHLIVQNGEIVAEGDVRESNGNVTRKYKVADLGSFTWTYDSQSVRFYSNAIQDIGGELYSGNNYYKNVMFSCYKQQVNTDNMGAFIYANRLIYVYDNRYTDATTFKTAVTGQKVQYELATPTTETSSPFADPMSLNGCTTEEYVDTRSIPVPVGHETQYMGQSEDVVEILSGSLSDGKRKLVAETSGGKTQYYFEDDKNGAGTQVGLATTTASNPYTFPEDGYISLGLSGLVGDYASMRVMGSNGNLICIIRVDVLAASHIPVQALFVKRGMKCNMISVSSGATLSALYTPLI